MLHIFLLLPSAERCFLQPGGVKSPGFFAGDGWGWVEGTELFSCM